MRISRLELHDFRNYTRWEIEPDSALTVFVGGNATGKTNVLEAAQLVSTGMSFRGSRWEDLVRWGSDRATVSMTAEGEGSHTEVGLTVESAGTRAWEVGGVAKRRTVDATRFVPVVAFTPDDLALAKGPAEKRRSAIDGLGEQLSATYGAIRRDYTRVVRQRNVVLREDGSAASLEPWDEQLVSLGATLHVHRRRLTSRILDAAAPVYDHLAGGETLDVRVLDKCGIDCGSPGDRVGEERAREALVAQLGLRREEERARKITLVGPHRDDIAFLINGRDARAYASQGQQRTISLAWKWAEVAVVADVLKRMPVLLLDDVMSELDEVRRRALTDLVQRDVQTLVTTTTTGYFDSAMLKEARVVSLGATS
ncbi:MAG: DNA replication and repair protein RecF [Coriobacteriia bacterium]|nr:DNA replication and repair protein RecF [Coriobacteriia bacterium]